MAHHSVPPTSGQQASALLHLERRSEWVSFRMNGTRYIRVPSANSASTYTVRADSRGCSCVWSQRASSPCSHRLAVAMASDPPAILVNVLDERISLTEAGQALVSKRRPTYSDIFPGCQAPGCQEDVKRGEHSCAKHQLVDAF